MTITLILMATLMGVVIWWLFSQSIGVKPWDAQGSIDDVHAAVLARPAVKTGLWVFLAVATSLFALFISAYGMRMHMGNDWHPLHEPRLLWWNTGLLIVTSAAMQWAVTTARRGDRDALRTALLVTGVLTFAFLAAQLVVWQQMKDAGYYIAGNPAAGFFYLLTAVHGVHVIGGLVAWGRTTSKLMRGAAPSRLRMSVELCAIYWHFLLVVWLVLFGLLLST